MINGATEKPEAKSELTSRRTRLQSHPWPSSQCQEHFHSQFFEWRPGSDSIANHFFAENCQLQNRQQLFQQDSALRNDAPGRHEVLLQVQLRHWLVPQGDQHRVPGWIKQSTDREGSSKQTQSETQNHKGTKENRFKSVERAQWLRWRGRSRSTAGQWVAYWRQPLAWLPRFAY